MNNCSIIFYPIVQLCFYKCNLDKLFGFEKKYFRSNILSHHILHKHLGQSQAYYKMYTPAPIKTQIVSLK